MLRAIAGLLAAVPHQSAIEVPTIRDDGSPRKHGRPKVHEDRPKPKERNKQYLTNRHKLLGRFLAELKVQSHEMNKAKRRKSFRCDGQLIYHKVQQ